MGNFKKENFEEFCGSTSLHAWNRLPTSPHPVQRTYWILIICGSILLGSYFVYQNLDQFLKAYSTTNIDTTTGPLQEGNFPKLVICNSYKVRQSFLDTIFNKSVITDDDSGYDTHELQEAFVKHFIKGYKEEEADMLRDKIDIVIEKYVKNYHFNETLARECPKDDFGAACFFDLSALEDRTDLEFTAGHSFPAMVLQYKIQDKKYYGGYIDWNGQHAETDIGECFGITPRYLGPDKFTDDPDADIDQAFVPKVLSGPPFGVDILLDAETYDNGDSEEPFDGFTMAVSDPSDTSLIGLNGFTVGTGSMARVSTQISIHKTADVVLSRFDSDERKCIDNSDDYNISQVHDGRYTMSKCLLDASIVKTMALECPEVVKSEKSLFELYGQDLYCSFTKVNAEIGHVKNTVTLDGKDVECQVACQRQENEIRISTQGFPGHSFRKTREFWLVVYKLFWSCKNENTRFGFKRPGLDRTYPNLCAYYDEYFFSIGDINDKIESFDEADGPKDFLDWQNQELRFSQLESKLGMDEATHDLFCQAVMIYCKDNLARVVVFIQKPFVSIYLHDQVMSYLQLVANMGGLMGLCMGFSVVSVAEIFYHLVINPLHQLCSDQIKKEEKIDPVETENVEAW